MASPAPGTQCPQGSSLPSPAGSAPSLGSFPFPKGNASLGLPSLRMWERALGCPLFPEQVLWSTAGAGCSSGMPGMGGHWEGTSAKGSHLDLETSFKHCHSVSPALAAMGTGMHLDFCTDIAQPPAPSAVRGHQPQTVFLSLSIQNSPWPAELRQESWFRWQWEGPLATHH